MKNIYVGNLTWDTTADELRELFEQYGRVAKAQVVSDRETGRSRGFGFVEMEEGGDEAIAALSGAPFKGRNLTVNEAKPREDRGGGGSRGGYGGGGGGGGYGGGGGRGGYGGGGRDRY
jgi:RNA recognition motif-containing protein